MPFGCKIIGKSELIKMVLDDYDSPKQEALNGKSLQANTLTHSKKKSKSSYNTITKLLQSEILKKNQPQRLKDDAMVDGNVDDISSDEEAFRRAVIDEAKNINNVKERND